MKFRYYNIPRDQGLTFYYYYPCSTTRTCNGFLFETRVSPRTGTINILRYANRQSKEFIAT